MPVDGGYLVSGSWSFASGIKHATHLHTAAADTETGPPRFFILPVEQVTFSDNWNVLGLCGTASIPWSPGRECATACGREPGRRSTRPFGVSFFLANRESLSSGILFAWVSRPGGRAGPARPGEEGPGSTGQDGR